MDSGFGNDGDAQLNSILRKLGELQTSAHGSSVTDEQVRNVRLIAALEQLIAAVQSRQAGAAELAQIWTHLQPCIFQAALRPLALQAIATVLHTHFDACDLLRLSFFDSVTAAVEATDTQNAGLRLSVFVELTKNGRDLRHIEHHLGAAIHSLLIEIIDASESTEPLLAQVRPDTQTQTQTLVDVLMFLSNVIKFSSIHLSEGVLLNLLATVQRLVAVTCMPAVLSACIDCLDSLIRY
eukprot:jgi/Hompol1/3619/HPOL_006648-RA